MSFEQYWDKLNKKNDEMRELISSYWSQYSSPTSVQFWVVLILTIIPLIILFIKIDRKRLFELLFFGYTAHILWTYYNIALERYGFINHPYFLTPALPYSINITASMLPVTFILLYQYCSNHNKNYYGFSIIASAVFAFIIGPIEGDLKFSVARKGLNLLTLFFSDIIIAYITYWFTKVILLFKNKNEA